MTQNAPASIGYTCSYLPLPLITAAGFTPYRILPLGEMPEQAGRLLHDNLCPHVKRVLDRALAEDLPTLDGVLFVNSCDAMRRLADAWENLYPEQPTAVLDLPATPDETAVRFFAAELSRLAATLFAWADRPLDEAQIETAILRHNELAALFAELADSAAAGRLPGGRARLQELYNHASCQPPEQSLAEGRTLLDTAAPATESSDRVPVYLFGNVMPDPEAFALYAACGVQVVGDDFCTGSRMFQPVAEGDESVFLRLARSLLQRPPCARTFNPQQPGQLAGEVLASARACGARGVIGQTLKFCDPYLARLPLVREELKTAGLPFLLLEGDCSLGAIGQQRTRIEAFVEMMR